jgi:hypothetical protein
LQKGGKLENSRELTSVSDRDERAKITHLRREI